jgi:hypothetical protein
MLSLNWRSLRYIDSLKKIISFNTHLIMKKFTSVSQFGLIFITVFSGLLISFKIAPKSMNKMQATLDPNGQVVISEGDKPVLRYNYQMVYEDDEFSFNGMDANEYVVTPEDTFMANPSIYAVPRSDYIHPLYGLRGEILTRDWSKDHPHHRGIYWAWPEVSYRGELSDLHALQKVFARPTGKIILQNKPEYAQIEAENLWITEEEIMPIVREVALIRAYPQKDQIRLVDLAFRFEALKEGVTIARRGTNAYGGLNIRMMTPESQEISFHTDESGTQPIRAWSDLSGVFAGNNNRSGLMVIQHPENPEYPGDWVQYPELSWIQPTFPSSGTRYPIEPKMPLLLRFRLVIHAGEKPEENVIKMLWDAYGAEPVPDFTF